MNDDAGAMDHVDLRGLWVPIVTPFDRVGEVDTRSLERLAHRLLGDGATGLVALGTTGEPATLTAPERRQVVEICDRVCQARGCGLVVGAGGNSTSATIEELLYLTDGTAAVAALVVVPYYTRPSESAVVEHFGLVADASPVPIVAYNVPYRTGRGLGAEAILELARHPRIIGLKQAVGALDVDTLEVLAGAGSDFAVLAGDDAVIAPTLFMGGVGAISAAAHLRTPMFAEMVEAALEGNVDRARAVAESLLPIVRIGFAEPSPAVWKAVLQRLGDIDSGGLRRPMTSASDAVVERMMAVLAAYDPGA